MPNVPPSERVVAFFRKNLLDWSAQNPRPLPWKGERDAYKVWLSEIILQQTRVEQGLPYYEKFIRQYPSVHHLAQAPDDELMKLWEGLGYYSRARNLHAAAKHISLQWGGVFPNRYPDILALKGVGHYTAAAIASFAFGLPHAVLDGNVYRVLARFFDIRIPINSPQAQKTFAELAQRLLDPAKPAIHNQAMMDFGALCCTPQKPHCATCPLSGECQAFLTGQVHELPVKTKAPARKKRELHYLVVVHQDDVFVQKRSEKDIWKGLWEFPQSDQPLLVSPLGVGDLRLSGTYRQLLTHQEIRASFYEIELPNDVSETIFQHPLLKSSVRMPRKDLKKNIAFPKVIDCYLESKALTLS